MTLTAEPATEPALPSPPLQKTPRLWPPLVLVGLYWLARLIVTLAPVSPFTQFLTIFYAPLIVAAGLLVWWFAFSRLPWPARFWGPACLLAGGLLAAALCHKSMYFGLLLYGLPMALTTVVACLLLTRGAPTLSGAVSLLAISLLTWGYFTLIRFDGVTGGFVSERSWRWSPTPEETFLAEQRRSQIEAAAAEVSDSTAASALVATAVDWPAFRGADRKSHLHGVSLDWSAAPPREVWRHRVGPGWSSFSVVGNHAYTQEQRGEKEAVVCLNIETGDEIWSHEDRARFEELIAGAGPRATPTFDNGRIYALGGSGVLNCLDAATGKSIWQRDIAEEAKTKPPQWGFSSSPLVAQGLVTVFAGGKDDKSVLAFDADTGEPRWSGGLGTHSYSSPQLERIAGVDQILMVSDHGLQSFEPQTGRVLWDHEWNVKDVFRVCQPVVAGPEEILLGTGMGIGTRLLQVTKPGDDWHVAEKWTSKNLKPYFNDSVIREGYLYGYDGEILACIDLATGQRKWKKGRYGYGQILMVGDEGHLLVVSEQGEIALVHATPSDLKEIAKFPAVKGKTWNHPVIAAGKLLVRNGEEMACFDLTSTKAITHAAE